MVTKNTQIPETMYSSINPADDLTQGFTVINNKLMTVVEYTTGEAIDDRDMLALNASGEVVKTLAGDSNRIPFIGVALATKAGGGGSVLVQTGGIVDLSPFEMNVGVPQVISGNTEGRLEDTLINIGGFEIDIVGVSLDKNRLMIIG